MDGVPTSLNDFRVRMASQLTSDRRNGQTLMMKYQFKLMMLKK